MARKKQKNSLTAKLNPLVLLKEWLHEQNKQFSFALQPAMPPEDSFTSLSVGTDNKWVGYVSLEPFAFRVFAFAGEMHIWIEDLHFYDPSSFNRILDIMARSAKGEIWLSGS